MQVVERGEDRLAPRVHVRPWRRAARRRRDARRNPACRRSGAVGLDAVEHAVDDLGDARLRAASIRRDENAGISSRRTRACCSPSIWVTNCASMILLNCSQPGPRGISEAKRLGVGEHPVHVGVAADDDLRRALAEHIERRPPRPFRHVAVGVRLEIGAAEVDVDDLVSGRVPPTPLTSRERPTGTASAT